MTPPILRTSERKDFKRCPQRWFWGWRMGLKPRHNSVNALWFGTGIHLALAEWYLPGRKRGREPVETWLDFCDEEDSKIRVYDEDGEAEWVDARDLGVAMLEGYRDRYGRDESWDVIAPEQPFQISIPNRSGYDVVAIYAGTFDLVYRDLEDGEIYLGEHKTAAQISLRHLSLDDQAGSYWAVAGYVLRHSGVLPDGEDIAGINYNFLKKSAPDDRPENEQGLKLNKNGSVSKRQPTPAFVREVVPRTKANQRMMIRKIQAEVAWMNAARKRPELIYKTPTDRCSWDCPFFDMCEMHEDGTENWREYAKAMFRREDPYKDHRKSAAE